MLNYLQNGARLVLIQGLSFDTERSTKSMEKDAFNRIADIAGQPEKLAALKRKTMKDWTKLKKYDKVICRTPAIMDENTYKPIGGHVEYKKPLTVLKVLKSGIKTKEHGFIHKNNILNIHDTEPTELI